MEGLSRFEKAVLDKLLAGDHPVLADLRIQAERGRVTSRDYTGVGFFCAFTIPPELRVSAIPDFHLGDVNGTVEGLQHGAGFVLFVRNGRLSMLEGYTYEERWPKDINDFDLTYQHEPRKLTFKTRAR